MERVVITKTGKAFARKCHMNPEATFTWYSYTTTYMYEDREDDHGPTMYVFRGEANDGKIRTFEFEMEKRYPDYQVIRDD